MRDAGTFMDFAQDLAGRHRIQVRHVIPILVIVDDLDLIGIAVVPAKADAPLVIDSNTVLACSLPREPLESITGRHSKALD